MNKASTGGWTPLHDVALIFLSLLHGTDATLDPSEVRAQRSRLKRWFPTAEPDAIQSAMDEVMLVYVSGSRDQMVQTAAEALRQTLSDEQRVGLLNDLADLAQADGVIAPGEVAFIQQLAAYWRVAHKGNDD